MVWFGSCRGLLPWELRMASPSDASLFHFLDVFELLQSGFHVCLLQVRMYGFHVCMFGFVQVCFYVWTSCMYV